MKRKRTFYKTVFTVTVLSEVEPSGDIELDRLHHQITEGDWSGLVEKSQSVKLTQVEVAEELIEQGSDPSFFMLDEHGNEMGEE